MENQIEWDVPFCDGNIGTHLTPESESNSFGQTAILGLVSDQKSVVVTPAMAQPSTVFTERYPRKQH